MSGQQRLLLRRLASFRCSLTRKYIQQIAGTPTDWVLSTPEQSSCDFQLGFARFQPTRSLSNGVSGRGGRGRNDFKGGRPTEGNRAEDGQDTADGDMDYGNERSVSVLDRFTDREGYITDETLQSAGVGDDGEGERDQQEGEEIEEEEQDKQDQMDQKWEGIGDRDPGETMFKEYLMAPMRKQRHLLRDLLSPKILGGEKAPGLDRADLVNEEHFYNFLVDIRLSQKAVKSGRITRYRSMMVVGDLKGLAGYGYGKSSTVHGSVERARHRALKSLIYIPRYREHTIYAPSDAKVTETKVLMWPRPRGFGVVANDMLFQVCELIGIMDISIKVIGRRNRFNTIKAFFEALEKIPTPLELAEEKGVYMRERAFVTKKRLRTLLEGWGQQTAVSVSD